MLARSRAKETFAPLLAPLAEARLSGSSPNSAASADLGLIACSYLVSPAHPHHPFHDLFIHPSLYLVPFHPRFRSARSSLCPQFFVPSSIMSASLTPPFVLLHPLGSPHLPSLVSRHLRKPLHHTLLSSPITPLPSSYPLTSSLHPP